MVEYLLFIHGVNMQETRDQPDYANPLIWRHRRLSSEFCILPFPTQFLQVAILNKYGVYIEDAIRNSRKGRSMSTKEQWDATASIYISLPRISNSEINFPAIIRHLGNIQKKVLLDYGCGYGHFARQLKSMGVEKVIATDTSESMIQLARAADPHAQVEYYLMSENALPFLKDGSVDKAVANLVFVMVPTATEIAESMREIHRVLCPGGLFVYIITHPCFVEKGAHDYHNVFNRDFHYMKEGCAYKFVLHDLQGDNVDEDFFDYHYTLTTYVNITLQAGFRIVGLEELSYPDEVIEKYAISREFQTFPQAIVIVGEK